MIKTVLITNLEQIQHFDKEYKRNYGRVYVYYSKDLIKIGITYKLLDRMLKIQNESGRVFEKVYITELLENYDLVEKQMHFKFRENRIVGEWFDIDFESAIKYLKSNSIIKELNMLLQIEEAQIDYWNYNVQFKERLREYSNINPKKFNDYLLNNNISLKKIEKFTNMTLSEYLEIVKSKKLFTKKQIKSICSSLKIPMSKITYKNDEFLKILKGGDELGK